jgi:hypothetical protein
LGSGYGFLLNIWFNVSSCFSVNMVRFLCRSFWRLPWEERKMERDEMISTAFSKPGTCPSSQRSSSLMRQPRLPDTDALCLWLFWLSQVFLHGYNSICTIPLSFKLFVCLSIYLSVYLGSSARDGTQDFLNGWPGFYHAC